MNTGHASVHQNRDPEAERGGVRVEAPGQDGRPVTPGASQGHRRFQQEWTLLPDTPLQASNLGARGPPCLATAPAERSRVRLKG